MARKPIPLNVPNPADNTTDIEPVDMPDVPAEQESFVLKGRTFRLAKPSEWSLAQTEQALIAAGELGPVIGAMMGDGQTTVGTKEFFTALQHAGPSIRDGVARRLYATSFIEEGYDVDDTYDFDERQRLMAAAPGRMLLPAITSFFGSIGLSMGGGS